ncbi:MAG: hypothetical protein Q7R57_08105 [Dehalococcoidales bacterium]|nr:hypothetical protein [Dehalococcoidales bacterium]
MANGPVIMVMGTECLSETEEAWSKWYSEKHVPDVLKFKGIKNATRYKIRDENEAARGTADKSGPQCPKYVAIYEFQNWQAVEGYNNSPERQVAVKDWNDKWVNKGARLVWRIYYEPIKSWRGDAPTQRPRVMIIVGTECQPGLDEEWNKWYNERHVPDVLKFKDMKKAARYKIKNPTDPAKGVAGESSAQYPTYLTIYEFDNLRAVDNYDRSPELAVAHDDWLNWTNTGRARLVWRTCYVPIESWSR